MSSDWDLPETQHRNAPAKPVADMRSGNGLVDPLALFGFIYRNIFRIAVIAFVLTAIGVVAIRFVPFPYRATATVLVDPRDQQVTLQEDVLRPIGSDAAVLESMVQIMKSDGFLLTVMDELGMMGDGKTRLNQQEQLKALAKFKKDLSVERKGATYLVEISFKADNPQDAARIANSVANGFADTQNGYLRKATQDAARALSERLVDLRRKLNASEKAVADFAAENGILYIDNDNTLEMRQLTELSAQLALAKAATEQARARYQSQVGGGAVLNDARNGEPEQLAFLRQQRAQLMQTLEQQSLTYGSRHPRIAQTKQLIAGIERQIRDEKQNLVRQLKGDLDVAEAQQAKLEADIGQLSSGAVLTDAAKVRLEALRREAAADRDIYEKFLSRNKATDELAVMETDNVRVVSPAVPPLRSSRPSLVLLAPVLGVLSTIAAIVMLAVAGHAGVPGREVREAHDRGVAQRDEIAIAAANDAARPDERESARTRRKANASLLTLAGNPDREPGRSVDAGTRERLRERSSPDRKTTSLLMMADAMRQPAGGDDGATQMPPRRGLRRAT